MADKKTLVIVPGWGGTKETWRKFIGICEMEFNVICIELPCFGDEPCPNSVWGVKEYANFIKTELLGLGMQSSDIILLGHSFGGVVSARLVAENPGICAKLILSGAPIIRKNRGIAKLIFWIAAKMGRMVFRIPFIERFDIYAKKAFYCLINSDYNETSGIKREIFKKIIADDQTGILSQIMCKTLVVFGNEDTYVDPEDGKKIATLIPFAELRLIQGGKHGLHIQQPENFYKIILEFSHAQ